MVRISSKKWVWVQLFFTLWTACARQFAPPHPPYNGGADGTRPSRGNGKILKVVYNIIVSKWDVSISMTLRKKLVAVDQGWHVLINISPDIYVRTNSELLGSELYAKIYAKIYAKMYAKMYAKIYGVSTRFLAYFRVFSDRRYPEILSGKRWIRLNGLQWPQM